MACICGTSNPQDLYERAIEFKDEGLARGLTKNNEFKDQATMIKACELFKRAAAQGHLESQYQLSWIFLNNGNSFTDVNRKKVEQWYGDYHRNKYGNREYDFSNKEFISILQDRSKYIYKYGEPHKYQVFLDMDYDTLRYPIFKIGALYLHIVVQQEHSQAVSDCKSYKERLYQQWKEGKDKFEQKIEEEVAKKMAREKFEKEHPELVQMEKLQKQQEELQQKLNQQETQLRNAQMDLHFLSTHGSLYR